VFAQGLKLCRYCLACFCCWTLWLGLLSLLGFQLYTATTKQMPVPAFLLHSLERQLARADITAQLGKTRFDPTGQIVIEDLRLSLPEFSEPVARIGSVYIQLEPWALLTRRFKADSVRASDLAFYIPAPLSGSGTREPLIEHAELALSTHNHQLDITQLSARIGRLNGLTLSVQGGVDTRPLLRRTEPQGETLLSAELFARYYPLLCRRLGELAQWTSGLNEARLDLDLAPSSTAGAVARLTLSGSGYEAPEEAGLHFSLKQFRATTTIPLRSEAPSPAELSLELESLALPLNALPSIAQNAVTRAPELAERDIELFGLHAKLLGQIDTSHLRFSADAAEAVLRSLHFGGDAPVTAQNLSLLAEFNAWPELHASAQLQIEGTPLGLSGTLDTAGHAAVVRANGQVAPSLIALISEWTAADIGQFLALGSPAKIDLKAQFAEGHFVALEGDLDAHDVFALGITFDQIGGHIRLADGRFEAPVAYASIGTNYARGSYLHDLATRDFRFLLNGQLNPPDIAAWFRPWWSEFWQKFDFPKTALPTASVDVQGRWGDPQYSRVFVYADAHEPTINGAALDHVRTRIYVRPNYYDAMEVAVRYGAQSARGGFTRRNDPTTKQLARQDFDFTSTLDLERVGALSGPEVQASIAPFHFAEPITLEATGYVAAHGERHFTLHGRTSSDFSLYDFPLNGLNFTAVVDDDTLLVDSLSAGLAEGIVSGRVRLQGQGDTQTLGFDLSLAEGKFYRWTGILSQYLARRRGEEPPPNVEKNTNVTIALDLSAEGSPHDALSFIGSGNMELKGRGLGQIHLFGLLSELLSFTSLNFNQLLTSFSVEREKLVFPEVNITGSNSAITASGHYAMDRGNLDFRARVNPFGESKFILKSIVGLMLTPVSNVLEVRLTGPLDKPQWSFLHFSPNPNKRNGDVAEDAQLPPDSSKPSEEEAPAGEEQPPSSQTYQGEPSAL